MTVESIGADGSTNPEKFNDLTETTTFYTYRSPTSRLPATRFIQTALTLMKKPHFEDMRSRGLIQGDSAFAPNSPGEYSALAAPAKVIRAQSLLSVAFYRGLTMQVAVERNTEGRSNYSMIAVNPSRISWTSITEIFNNIANGTKRLHQVVNYTFINRKYICAGHVSLLSPISFHIYRHVISYALSTSSPVCSTSSRCRNLHSGPHGEGVPWGSHGVGHRNYLGMCKNKPKLNRSQSNSDSISPQFLSTTLA